VAKAALAKAKLGGPLWQERAETLLRTHGWTIGNAVACGDSEPEEVEVQGCGVLVTLLA